MNLNRPLTSLIPTLEGEVLTVLAGADKAFTGSQVHELVGKHSDRGIRNALQKLNVQGIVSRTAAGAADLYKLNPEHLMTKYIRSVVNLKIEFLHALKKEVINWKIQAECCALFGSAARSDMDLESDIDIFIVRSNGIDFNSVVWRTQLAVLSSKIKHMTGNDAQIFELNRDGIKMELMSKEGVLYSVIEQGIIFHGPSEYLRTLRYKKSG